jgi:probable biosynthetic protein (TIGR04098 family)
VSVSLVPRLETSEPERAALPAAPRRLRIGMPHLDVGGLSENWLHRYAGDLHWEAIGRRLGVATDEIRAEGDHRLYPTVVALRARYQAPLSAIVENDVLEASLEVTPCGGACAHGRVDAVAGKTRLSVELLTTFAARQPDGKLRMALPAARLAARWRSVGLPPPLARLASAARRGQPLEDRFAGPTLEPAGPPLGRLRLEPSPYSDYNGAGLLYFASYPTLADTAERRLVKRLRLSPRSDLDWALGTSPVRRDVFYYGNLPLGEALWAELLSFELDGAPESDGPSEPNDSADRPAAGVKTRVRLRRPGDRQPIADVITRRLFVRGGA